MCNVFLWIYWWCSGYFVGVGICCGLGLSIGIVSILMMQQTDVGEICVLLVQWLCCGLRGVFWVYWMCRGCVVDA